ncbi:hypothetical protein CFC21_059104 [Triticum aestivum]|uniref:Uncharacterized protein n=2 Tax=Triticum aestivum TaxID=4565 RepID=A0A9R1KEA0_WHEAT|nr:hypothetical protein CFC21_059104 [Triticum aestivum]
MPTHKGMRRSLVLRTLERCKSGTGWSGGAAPAVAAGCFSVYVGPERERFMVRTDCANHPLFRRLLDDAEREYGCASQGPLALPCDVDAFLDVLWPDGPRRRRRRQCRRGRDSEGGVADMRLAAG